MYGRVISTEGAINTPPQIQYQRPTSSLNDPVNTAFTAVLRAKFLTVNHELSRGLMSMSKAKIAAAQAYIEAKEYDRAREILSMSNDPSAVQWLQQLERIAPSDSNFAHRSPTRITSDDPILPKYPLLGQMIFLLGLFVVLRLAYLANPDLILITQPVAAFIWYRLYVLRRNGAGIAHTKSIVDSL
jgi:hypothetical protein